MNACETCHRPTGDVAYHCTHCGITTPTRHLNSLTIHAEAAYDKATGTARTTTDARPPGKPGSRLPFDLAAASRVNAVDELLATWIRRIRWERHGINQPPQGGGLHPIALAYLATNLEWMRHRLDASTFYTDLAASERVIRQLANGRPERHYLGPCGHTDTIDVSTGMGPMAGVRQTIPGRRCPGDVYANHGATHGTCNTCRATVRTADRRAWLDDLVRDYAFTAADIAGAYPIPRNTINQWHTRGRLTPHHWDHNGHPHFTLGDVLDLAAETAARRAQRKART